MSHSLLKTLAAMFLAVTLLRGGAVFAQLTNYVAEARWGVTWAVANEAEAEEVATIVSYVVDSALLDGAEADVDDIISTSVALVPNQAAAITAAVTAAPVRPPPPTPRQTQQP